ncbi:MAG: sensor histidine kinase [Hyphomicrobiales bacterium]
MANIARISSWPLTWKVPVLVAGLMVGIAVLISQVVLSRLATDQENNLRQLTSAYLDGLSAAVLPTAIRADTWEAFDALDRARTRYSGVDARYAIVELPNGKVLAASDPIRFPVQSVIPAELARRFPAEDGLIIDNGAARAWLARTLREEGFAVGRILAEIDIADLLRVRREVLLTLILVNAGLTVAFAAIGYAALKRMLQPLGVLTAYVERIRDGRVEFIPEQNRQRLASEFGQIFDRFNAMAHAVGERESLASRLAEQEKYAMLGRLASGMAHEVNNPLGGLFNALDTLRRHGGDSSVREATLNLLQRGLTHIRNLVRSTLVIYRAEASPHSLKAADIDDLRLLIEPEAARKSIRLGWINDIRAEIPVAAGSVRQATLNLLINACAATPPGGTVRLSALTKDSSLTISVGDEGPGLPTEQVDYLVAGSDDTPPAGGGLGLWIVRRLVAEEGGSIRVTASENLKTVVQVVWPFKKEAGSNREKLNARSEALIHAE